MGKAVRTIERANYLVWNLKSKEDPCVLKNHLNLSLMNLFVCKQKLNFENFFDMEDKKI